MNRSNTKRLSRLTISVCLFSLITGCSKDLSRRTVVEVKNFSDRPISVVNLSGFQYKISKMRLNPGKIVTSDTPLQDIPEDFTIHWSFLATSAKPASSTKDSKLSLDAIPISQRKGKFVLEFSKRHEWKVKFEPLSP